MYSFGFRRSTCLGSEGRGNAFDVLPVPALAGKNIKRYVCYYILVMTRPYNICVRRLVGGDYHAAALVEEK